MEGPGVSLFQGSDSLKLTTNGQREEEEEFLKDERRRKEELNNLFEKAFDDLIDDDMTSDESSYEADNIPGRVNESGDSRQLNDYNTYDRRLSDGMYPGVPRIAHQEFEQETPASVKSAASNKDRDSDDSSHYEYCYRASPDENDEEIYNHTDSYSLDQLKVLYNVRLREVEKLTRSLDAEKESKKQVLKKLTYLEAEKENAFAVCREKEALLESREERIKELEQMTLDLKKTVLTVEKEKKEMEKDIMLAKEQANHLQRTLEMMERCDANINREKQFDAMLESVSMKHQKEMMYQKQRFDALLAKYNQKEKDYIALEDKLEALERRHSELLLEKCDSSARQETTLQVLLDESNKEKIDLHKELQKVQRDRDLLKEEIQRYESFTKHISVSSSDENDVDSMYLLGMSRTRDDSKRPSVSDLNAKLKDELYKAIISQKTKRQEIKKLQEQVRSKELQIHEMKEKERKYLSESESLKTDLSRIMEHWKKKELSISESQEMAALKEDLRNLSEEREGLLKKIEMLNGELSRVKSECVEILRNESLEIVDQATNTSFLPQDEALRDDLQALRKEFEGVKQMYAEAKADREKLSILLEEELQRNSDNSKVIERLKMHIAEKESQYIVLETTIECLKKENFSLTEKLREHSAVKEDATVLKSLKDEASLLRSQLMELESQKNAEIELLSKDLEKIRHQLSTTGKMEEAAVKSLKEENDKLVRQLNEINEAKSSNAVHLPSSKPPSSDAIIMTEPWDNEKLLKERLQTELKAIETEWRKLHTTEIAATEERVKNATINYFTEEMSKMDAKHKMDFQAFLEKERVVIDELQAGLAQKQKEIDTLKQRGFEGAQEKLKLLRNQVELDRKKIAEIMSSWIREVQEMKNTLAEKDKEVLALKAKLQSVKKAAKVYKQRSKENDLKYEERYQMFLREIQSRVHEIVSDKHAKVEETLQKIEFEYQTREKDLREQLSRALKSL